MVYYQTKNPNFGKFWGVFQWEMMVYFMVIWSILQPFGIFYCHLVYIFPFWYVVQRKIWQPCRNFGGKMVQKIVIVT
jgi:hypothetical protein